MKSAVARRARRRLDTRPHARNTGTILIVTVNILFSTLMHILRIDSLGAGNAEYLSQLWCDPDLIGNVMGIFGLIALASVADIIATVVIHRKLLWSTVTIHVLSVMVALGNMWVFLELYFGPATYCAYQEVS